MLFLSAPAPDHERYFEELLELLSNDIADEAAVMNLREKYDIQQITPLRYDAGEGAHG
jgi:hypothetical protein